MNEKAFVRLPKTKSYMKSFQVQLMTRNGDKELRNNTAQNKSVQYSQKQDSYIRYYFFHKIKLVNIGSKNTQFELKKIFFVYIKQNIMYD